MNAVVLSFQSGAYAYVIYTITYVAVYSIDVGDHHEVGSHNTLCSFHACQPSGCIIQKFGDLGAGCMLCCK